MRDRSCLCNPLSREAEHQGLKDPEAAARQPWREQWGRGALTKARGDWAGQAAVPPPFLSWFSFLFPILAGILFSLVSTSSLPPGKVVQELAGDAFWPPCHYI